MTKDQRRAKFIAEHPDHPSVVGVLRVYAGNDKWHYLTAATRRWHRERKSRRAGDRPTV